jgi:ribosomal protein L12E/L44/L45/RPP1/RPP2
MPIKDNRLIELALEALEEKRRGIDEEISQIRSRLGSGGKAKAAAATSATSAPKNGRKKGKRKMTAAQKKLVSDRMKKYWADRKKGKK